MRQRRSLWIFSLPMLIAVALDGVPRIVLAAADREPDHPALSSPHLPCEGAHWGHQERKATPCPLLAPTGRDSDRDSLALEFRALELEAEGDELRLQAVRLADQFEQRILTAEGNEEVDRFSTDAGVESPDLPQEIRDMMMTARQLEQEAQALRLDASVLVHQATEDELLALEFEALELEAAAEDSWSETTGLVDAVDNDRQTLLPEATREGFVARDVFSDPGLPMPEEAEDLVTEAARLVQRAVELRSNAAALVDSGAEDEAMDLEFAALELEARADDLWSQVEVLITDSQGDAAIWGLEEESDGADAQDARSALDPYVLEEIDRLSSRARSLDEEARALRNCARTPHEACAEADTDSVQ